MKNKNLLVQDLKVTVGPKKHKTVLFDNFTYNFSNNKIYFIMGKSGVGKTTLVSFFNGLKKSDKGIIIINDSIKIIENQKRIKNYKEIRKEVGFLFQYPSWQICKDTCIKDVAFGPTNFGIKKPDAIKIASKCLNQIGIKEELFNNSIYALSNGQLKRTAIAGVMAIDPSIYIMDEPTAGLDAKGKKELINIINSIKKDNKVVIIVSHDVEFAFEIADEIIVLDNNKILCAGTPYSVFTNTNISSAHLVQPKLIQFVEKLKSNESIYKQILEVQPRSTDALLSILKPFSGSGGDQ